MPNSSFDVPELFDSVMLEPLSRFGTKGVERADVRRLASATARAYWLLRDGCWHSTEELRVVAGSSGDRRARDLRDRRYAGGLPVDCRRLERGLWVYRLDRTVCPAERLVFCDRLFVGGEG